MSWLPSYAEHLKKGEAHHNGQQFNTSTSTGETGKRPAVALYLDELLIKYVNSEVDRSSFSHHGFPPVGPWHLVGATMDNTLD